LGFQKSKNQIENRVTNSLFPYLLVHFLTLGGLEFGTKILLPDLGATI
jgi:hypothetical protein